jgi:hypothetical protein
MKFYLYFNSIAMFYENLLLFPIIYWMLASFGLCGLLWSVCVDYWLLCFWWFGGKLLRWIYPSNVLLALRAMMPDIRLPIFMALQQKPVSSCVYLCLWQRRNYLALGCRFNFNLCSVGPWCWFRPFRSCVPRQLVILGMVLSPQQQTPSIFSFGLRRERLSLAGDLSWFAWHFGYGYDPAFSLTGSTKV